MPSPFHLGTFLLFAAFALLLVSTVSAPVFKQLSFLNIVGGGSTATLGVFGYCGNIETVPSGCTNTALGYSVSNAVAQLGGFGGYSDSRLDTLTKALILHPIGTGLSFLAFIVALLSSRLGFLLASIIAFLAFICTLAALVIDFVLFALIRSEINGNTASYVASFSNAIWITLAAVIVLFFAQFIVCFSCLGARRERRKQWRGRKGDGVIAGNNVGMGIYGEGLGNGRRAESPY